LSKGALDFTEQDLGSEQVLLDFSTGDQVVA
jgi:hypothetical protein